MTYSEYLEAKNTLEEAQAIVSKLEKVVDDDPVAKQLENAGVRYRESGERKGIREYSVPGFPYSEVDGEGVSHMNLGLMLKDLSNQIKRGELSLPEYEFLRDTPFPKLKTVLETNFTTNLQGAYVSLNPDYWKTDTGSIEDVNYLLRI